MAEPQTTGIKNADELITLAHAYGLTVTVETTERETITSYLVRFAIPVPAAYAGTGLGHAIANDTLTMLWTKPNKGGRGRLEDTTAYGTFDRRKLHTLRMAKARVETLGHDAQKYAREAAPLPEAVVDAPHAVFVDGHQVHAGIPAAHVRKIVSNRRFRGHLVHQDDDKAIVCETRRYVPVLDAPADETPAPARECLHVRIANGATPEILPSRLALKEINHAMMDGKRDVREMSASYGHARIVYRDQRGTVELRRATAEDLAAYAPETEQPAPAPPATEEERAAEADRIRTATAREAYAFGVRLEAQQLATRQVIEERARESLTSVLHEEAEDGKAGFVFRTNHLAVCLRGVTAEGEEWPLLTEALQLHLEHHGWFVAPSPSHGVRITPPGDVAEIVEEAKRRNVAAAHDQALAENATQELRAVILAVADLMDEDEARTRAAYGAAQTIPISMAAHLISGALTRVRGDFDATYADLLQNKSQSAATVWASRGNALHDQAFTALYPDGLRSRPLTADQVRATANAPKLAQH